MSISMVLQNFSPIRGFLHNKWAQNMAAEEKKTKQNKKKKKKKVGKPIGDPVGTGCPNEKQMGKSYQASNEKITWYCAEQMC